MPAVMMRVGIAAGLLCLLAGCSPGSPGEEWPAAPATIAQEPETNDSDPDDAVKAAPEPAYASVSIDGVPHVRQKPDFCGEACAEMFLRKLGHRADQDYVFDQSGLDPVLGRGCYTKELAAALTKIGFRIGPVYQRIDPRRSAKQLESAWQAIHADLEKGVPSIVCMHFDDQPQTTEHFRLILGYDAETDEVIYHEPAEDRGAYQRMGREQFTELWPLKYQADEWLAIRLRLAPGKIEISRPTARFTNADYCQHIMRLKRRLPNEDFTIVLQRPFVVAGDEPAETVRRRAEQTVGWSVERLKGLYFEKDPTEILDVWLFKDKDSYETNAKLLFGSEPTTPYGYYSPLHRALVMNIATGGGTLVHEIVHPFMAANFPQCPAWFNEGLASLYEQSGEKEGHIHGYTNWRLPGLQDSIKAKRVPTFEELCGTTTDEFYYEDRGTNYGQARYLCYYLQQRDQLVQYFRQFRADCGSDPTGYKTLQAVLGTADMQAFQGEWEAYVLKLRFN